MKTVVIMFKIEQFSAGMKCGMIIEYLKHIADLNSEVDFGVNGAIGTIVTK